MIYRSFGPPKQVLEEFERERGDLLPGQVGVRMLLSPINPSDLVPVFGSYAHRVTPPALPGYEGVGVIDCVSEGLYRLLGQRVIPCGFSGTWQSHLEMDARDVIVVPDTISDSVASRAYINPLAALLMLQKATVAGRDIVLTAGGSSCALILGQWALQQGAKSVVALTRNNTRDEFLLSNGINACRYREFSLPRPGDATVFDAVGGQVGDNLIARLGKGSEFVSYGLLSGSPLQNFTATIQPSRFHLRDWVGGAHNQRLHNWFAEVFRRLETTCLPEICEYAFDDWRAALDAFHLRDRWKKPVLRLGHPA